MSLLHAIESCLRLTAQPPSRFGRESVRDPRLVHDLRRGRQPGPRVERRVRAFIAAQLAARTAGPAAGPAGQSATMPTGSGPSDEHSVRDGQLHRGGLTIGQR